MGAVGVMPSGLAGVPRLLCVGAVTEVQIG